MDIKRVGPSFGMALKIKPAAVAELNKRPIEYIYMLQKAGKKFENYKYTNLTIGENLSPRVEFTKTGEVYKGFAPDLKEPDNKFLKFNTWLCPKEGISTPKPVELEFISNEEAKKAYANLKDMKSSTERAIEFTRMAEKSEAIKYGDIIKPESATDVSEAVKNLFEKYGTK